MIQKDYWVMDEWLDRLDAFSDEDAAREFASECSRDNGSKVAVMLKVPVIGLFPELRALVVYDEEGKLAWETTAYQSEMVG